MHIFIVNNIIYVLPCMNIIYVLLCMETYISLSLQVPHVNRTDYQLIDISEDGFVRVSFMLIALVHLLK